MSHKERRWCDFGVSGLVSLASVSEVLPYIFLRSAYCLCWKSVLEGSWESGWWS